MKYITLFGASFVFVVLRHFSSQRNKQSEIERGEFMVIAAAAAEREKERERERTR